MGILDSSVAEVQRYTKAAATGFAVLMLTICCLAEFFSSTRWPQEDMKIN